MDVYLGYNTIPASAIATSIRGPKLLDSIIVARSASEFLIFTR